MRIIDAHSHINPKADNPLQDLLFEMDENNVEKSVLILNLPEEREIFQNEYDLYLANKDRFALSYGLDFNNKKSKIELNAIIEKTDGKVAIKIHPKLFRFERKDIPAIIESVREYEGLPIIVDSLYYGEDIEHHIGVDVSVALAREYNDRNIVVAHAGSLDFLKCMMSCRYMFHVSFDYSFIISFLNHTSLRMDMVNFLSRTSNRIMFGSDRPSFQISKAIADMQSIAEDSGINDKQLEDIFYTNALKVYW